ncbi:MAG TPA: AMP-binding protein [Candidatus Limnocylindria bacterium]|jgi:acyl-CoA synthetase (AMP-forming)/AMP-acid ligase II|nr:AMP-binding protein [Candidatus Limnocylindria bacterium]
MRKYARTLDGLLAHAHLFDDRPFLLGPGGTALSYAEFLGRVDAVAAWLQAHNIQRWDKMGVFLPKSAAEAMATLAINRLGGVFVNLSSKTTPGRAAEILRECELKALFTTPHMARELVSTAREIGCQLITVPGKAAGVESTGWADIPDLAARPGSLAAAVDNDLAAILYTSGSTGRSKGVMISQRNFLDATARVADYLELSPSDRLLSVLPLSAPWGFLQLTTALHSGASVILQPVAFPVEIVRSVRAHGITGLAAMPPTWIQLVDQLENDGESLPELRYITSSGGVIPPRILEAFPRVFPNARVYLTYGLTEAFRTTVLPPEWFARKAGSLGRPCPNVDIFVIDHGRGLCGPGQRGELIHRGAAVTLGYWKDEEATRAVYKSCPELRPYIGDEVVHYSGDIVETDTDGFLWFVGRRDALIKVAGYRVSAEEIEIAAAESGLVSQAVAFAQPDPVFGQAIHLAIEPLAGQPFDADQFLSHCRRTLPTHMVPKRLHAWDESMPRTGTGKIDRHAVIRVHAGSPGASAGSADITIVSPSPIS